MQRIAPVSSARNPNQHTTDEVLAALRGVTGSRFFTFRYELLSNTNAKKDDLDSVVSCSIEQNWLADIKRTARLQIRDSALIDFQKDRIKPWVRLHLPPYDDADWVEWPQGVFLLKTPGRNADNTGVLRREITGYDPLQAFVDDKVTNRYTVAKNTKYVTAVSTLLGSIPKVVSTVSPYGARTLPAARDWDPGTTKLQIINDLLVAAGYESLSFDEDGTARVVPYILPQDHPQEYEYADDAVSILAPEVAQELDLFDIPNKWTLTVSEPDRPGISASYTNTDPSSPTSTVRRGRTIVDFRRETEAANLATLQERVKRLAFEASQVYEAVEFDTAMMPIHSGNDVYRIKYGPLGINAKYAEQSWSLDLRTGAKMKHRARRVVTI